MADISNLKINKRANVEQSNLRESTNGRTIPKFANFWNFDNFPN